MAPITGMWAATLTAFTAGNRVDGAAISRHSAWLTAHGISGLAPCGTTGEMLYLSATEKQRVLDAVLRGADGQIPVLAGVWALTCAEARRLAEYAERAGAAGVFLPPPIYYPASDDVIYRWYSEIRSATALPVYAYNIPAYACNSVTAECLDRLLSDGVIAGIKDSTGKAEQVETYQRVSSGRAAVIAASDGSVLQARELGADAFLSALANVWPKLLIAAWGGDGRLQPPLNSARTAIKAEGGIPALKYLASLAGYPVGESRLPQSSLTAAQRERLDSSYKDIQGRALALRV